MMTTKQQSLIETLVGRRIDAAFDSDMLHGDVTIKRANGKKCNQHFEIAFDDADELDGPCVTRARGTYAEGFARDAFFEILRIGQGDDEAIKFANECRTSGTRIGATQEWIDAHADSVAPVGC